MGNMLACPKCGCQIYRVMEVGTIHPVDQETYKIDFEAVPQEHFSQYYQCRNCNHKLIDDDNNVINDHQKLQEWAKNNLP